MNLLERTVKIKIAYIISAYKLPNLLIRIVERLQADNVVFFIHVDKKTSTAFFNDIKDRLGSYKNVNFLERHICNWGDFGHVKATLKGISALLSQDIVFDYVILLTGQDYPIKSTEDINSFFLKNKGKSFMSFVRLPDKNWDVVDRLERRFFYLGALHVGLPLRIEGGRFAPLNPLKKFINIFFPKRSFVSNMQPYGGLSYWALSNEAIRYVMNFLEAHPEYERFFKSTLISDEFFFQTILMNSPLKEEVVNNSYRYLIWYGKSRNPGVLTMADFSHLCSSDCLFARKFDPKVDEEILDMIDSVLLNK